MSQMNKSILNDLLEANPELNISVYDYNINVTSNAGDVLSADKLYLAYQNFDGAGKDAHLYLHLPLCDYICHFCNYVKRKVDVKNKVDELDMWANLLIKEMSIYLNGTNWVRKANITSFYIGGGTGALLLNNEAAIRKLMGFIRENFALSADCELSLEGNPENFTDESVRLAQELGFNRFSIGVQSLQLEVNKFSNRGHTPDDAIRAINLLKSSGMPFSVDMMFGLPYQTPVTVGYDIQTLVDMGVPCITIYRLRNAEREKMGIGNASVWNSEKYQKKFSEQAIFPDVMTTYQMRDAATSALRKGGYHPSPCGWWNKPEIYPDGNIPHVSKDKWEKYNTMLAFGPGAYGWLTGDQSEYIQTHNMTDIRAYVELMQSDTVKTPLSYGRILQDNIAIGTRLSFAFKANQAIYFEEYKSLFGVDLLQDDPYREVFATLFEKDLMSLSADGKSMQPTWKGEELHEEIMYYYFHKLIGGSDSAMCKRVAIPLKQVA